jgi:hypothetical protein
MTFSITTLRLVCDAQNNSDLPLCWVSRFINDYAEWHNVECRFAERRNDEWPGAEIRLTGENHRDRTQASTRCCFCLFFSTFEHAKNLLIMYPNNTENSSKSVIFSYLTMNNIVRILFFIAKNTKFDQKTVSLPCVKTKSWAHKQPT